MFETAVKEGSDIAIKTPGGQQNSEILGNGCAIFLAKFLAKLALRYTNLSLGSKGPINKQLFKKALELNLMDLSIEDLQEHGRLLVLKEKLVSMVDPNDKLDIKTLGLF